jgi:hypothetical protein
MAFERQAISLKSLGKINNFLTDSAFSTLWGTPRFPLYAPIKWKTRTLVKTDSLVYLYMKGPHVNHLFNVQDLYGLATLCSNKGKQHQ